MLTASLPVRHVSAFAADVRESLTKPGQRELPSKYLYDEVGSALFETICVLPEYGLTRADARLLEKYAREIVGRLPSPIQVAELGSGTGKKTRWILEALSRRQKTYYYPIEISPSALAALAKELGQIDMVSIVGYEQPYLEGLRSVADGRGERDHLLVLFLGSTIGNFDHIEPLWIYDSPFCANARWMRNSTAEVAAATGSASRTCRSAMPRTPRNRKTAT